MSSLIILWLSYALVGWKLSLTDIIYYLVLLISLVVILLSVQDEPWIQGVFGYIPQAVTVILILSLLFTFVIAYPETVFLVVVPALSTYLAWQEMSAIASGGFSPRLRPKLMTLLVTALLGLVVGEVIDVFFFSSHDH